jgi:hypothetical protein
MSFPSRQYQPHNVQTARQARRQARLQRKAEQQARREAELAAHRAASLAEAAASRARQVAKAIKPVSAKAERAADQAAARQRSESVVAAYRAAHPIEPDWPPWEDGPAPATDARCPRCGLIGCHHEIKQVVAKEAGALDEEAGALDEEAGAADRHADDIALTVLAEMARAALVPPDRYIPDFGVWIPPWKTTGK